MAHRSSASSQRVEKFCLSGRPSPAGGAAGFAATARAGPGGRSARCSARLPGRDCRETRARPRWHRNPFPGRCPILRRLADCPAAPTAHLFACATALPPVCPGQTLRETTFLARGASGNWKFRPPSSKVVPFQRADAPVALRNRRALAPSPAL